MKHLFISRELLYLNFRVGRADEQYFCSICDWAETEDVSNCSALCAAMADFEIKRFGSEF